jgi:hypothetical protein
MVQSPWEANSHSDGQKILRVNKTPLLVPILSQMNTPYLPKIYSNIMLPSMPNSSE